ncbi:hypothetical protein Scep_020590 [Stephania cephalantha]|uniref:AAA+ ATPase domain-containing protein n=1 Tax=Stephania cephalantha TaxID=152367 RepID=A0AAP0IE05_9MAGN
MSSLPIFLSTNNLFNAYACVSAFAMLFRSIIKELIPDKLRNYIESKIQHLNPFPCHQITILIEESDGLQKNVFYNATETYLSSIVTPSVGRLKVMKEESEDNLSVVIDKGQELHDAFQGISLKWRSFCTTNARKPDQDEDTSQFFSKYIKEKLQYYELSFHKKHKDKVVSEYLPYIVSRSKAIKQENKAVKIHTLARKFEYRETHEGLWESVTMGHPSSFDTLALDPEMKEDIMQDLNKFVRRKEFYKRVGKAWKRGYLLYGPPGTGKSSLIAAMANYLKFDVYDLELSCVPSDLDLRRVLISIANRSIIVVEDIDCTGDLKRDESNSDLDRFGNKVQKWTLSGLLNFIDGLWSSCGDERVIVFTTNYKDRLDPALLRPGRMDKHIHMSYLTMRAFDVLANNYLGIKDGRHQHEKHFKEIEDLIEKVQVTPAEVAEELMKSDDADESLGGVVKFLQKKYMEVNEAQDETEKKTKIGFGDLTV